MHGPDALAEAKRRDREEKMATAPTPQHPCHICSTSYVQRKSLYNHLRKAHGSDAEVKTQHKEQKKVKMAAQVAATKKRVTEEKAEKKKKKAADKEANRQPQPFNFARDINRGQVSLLLLKRTPPPPTHKT